MKILDIVLDLLFPPRCAFCRKLLNDGEKGICRACRRSLPYVPETAAREYRDIAKCVAPLYYEGSVRESLLRYKFAGLSAYGQVYAGLVARCVEESGISCDLVTWAPLSWRRLRKRGYDQARLIAEGAARELGLPCVKLLAKTRNNPPQSSLGSEEKRRANARGVYRCRDGAAVLGKRILIIDDIVTTGATLCECARVLRAAGAAEVFAAAAACGRDR